MDPRSSADPEGPESAVPAQRDCWLQSSLAVVIAYIILKAHFVFCRNINETSHEYICSLTAWSKWTQHHLSEPWISQIPLSYTPLLNSDWWLPTSFAVLGCWEYWIGVHLMVLYSYQLFKNEIGDWGCTNLQLWRLSISVCLHRMIVWIFIPGGLRLDEANEFIDPDLGQWCICILHRKVVG